MTRRRSGAPPPASPGAAGIALSDDQRLAWLQLIRTERVGSTTFIELIKRYGTASAALEALPELSAKGGGGALRVASKQAAESELDRLHRFGGQLVCLGEPTYPPALRAADAPPPVLSVLGSDSVLIRPAVAIVGSRNASLAGTKLCKSLASDLAAAGLVVVSGLARGIDAAAHAASLDRGTIAVFAGGIDHIYPRENAKLARSIVDQGGAWISEMPFAWRPRAQDFPRRNRIVAGLSLGLVVVEAARRSGSLISARLANEMGRLVFAVPGSPLDPRAEGTNDLIKQGAQLITRGADVIAALKPTAESPLQSSYSLDESRQITMDKPPSDSQRNQILDAIGYTPVTLDDVVRHTGHSIGTVQLIILELDLAGRIERHAGNRVSRT